MAAHNELGKWGEETATQLLRDKGSVAPFFSFCRAFLMLLSKLFAPVETPFFLSVKNRLLKVCKKFGRVVFIHYFRWRKDK